MIPKIIHYCWFGGHQYSDIVQKCINSWHKELPEYKFILWNEQNFNISIIPYVHEAYKVQKWAFVSDFVRFYALYKYGGIYLDTDVEILKDLSPLLSHKAFMGFESKTDVNPGLIVGSEPNNEFFKELLSTYKDEHFVLPDNTLNQKTIVARITEVLVSMGLKLNGETQTINDITIYSTEYFCPIDRDTCRLNITSNTYSIHHYVGSWLSWKDQIRIKVLDLLKRYKIYQFLKYIK